MNHAVLSCGRDHFQRTYLAAYTYSGLLLCWHTDRTHNEEQETLKNPTQGRRQTKTQQEPQVIFDHMDIALSKAFKSVVLDSITCLPQHQQPVQSPKKSIAHLIFSSNFVNHRAAQRVAHLFRAVLRTQGRAPSPALRLALAAHPTLRRSVPHRAAHPRLRTAPHRPLPHLAPGLGCPAQLTAPPPPYALPVENLKALLEEEDADLWYRFIFNHFPTLADEVTCDVLRIRQILTNLISNAGKFTHEGKVGINLHVLDKQPPGCRIEGGQLHTKDHCNPSYCCRAFFCLSKKQR
ncbi:hypothetical protein ABZP36_005390 [Zizania latifolia]